MKGKKILLAINGSEQSRFASELCWKLATELGADLTAQHVVDSHSAWEFLGHEKPGFLESSEYLEVYSDLVVKLIKLGEKLAISYATETCKLAPESLCLVDEGNPITEICKRAMSHNLVVIGHKPTASQVDPRSQFHRLSVAESLAHYCPVPLLIVQGKCRAWTSLSMLISLDHINESFINAGLDFANALHLKPSLLCLAASTVQESVLDDLREANPRLANIPMAVTSSKNQVSVTIDQWKAPGGASIDSRLWENPLMLIPTREVAEQRLTVLDSSPSMFVRNLAVPSVLLWPEEDSSGMKEILIQKEIFVASK